MARRPGLRPEVTTLEQLYALVPRIDCKMLCAETCGSIPLSATESRRICAESGISITDQARPCEALSAFATCRVHAIRPLICRLWGVVENMRCPHGCIPERVLTLAEAHEIVQVWQRLAP